MDIMDAFKWLVPSKPNKAQLAGLAAGVTAATLLGAYFGIGTLGYLFANTVLGGIGFYAANELSLHFENKRLGVRPPKINVKRLANIKTKDEDDKEEERAVFTLSNVKVMDLEAIKHAITQIATHTNEDSDPPTYNFNNKPTYSIKLVTNADVTLGELDYTNWEENSNFSIEVTHENGTPVSEDERSDVLKSLDVMSIFLGTNFYDPNAVATEKIAVSSKGILGKIVNFFESKFTKKVNLLEVDPASPYSPTLESDAFLELLVTVAIKTGKYTEILGHYREVQIATNQRSSNIKIEEIKTEQILRGKEPNKLVTGIFAATTIATAGAAITLGTGLGATLGVGTTGAIFTITAATLGIALPIVLGIMALVALTLTAIRGLQHYKKYQLAQNLKKTESQKALKETALNEKFAGLDATTQAIEKCVKKGEKNIPLSLEGKNIGDICARIISKWICSIPGSVCTEINLANNHITSEGAIVLAQTLKTSHVKTINLTKNPFIEQNGIEAIKNALLENFTITNLAYDKSWRMPGQLKQEIDRQLLINEYLQNGKISPNNLRQYFKGRGELLLQAAKEKISNAKTLACIQPIEIKGKHIVIKEALIKKQINLIFNNQPPLQQLANYTHIYHHIHDLAFASVPQKKVLHLIKTTLFNPRGKITRYNNATPLANMENSARTDLLKRCLLATHYKDKNNPVNSNIYEHAVGIATLTSELLDKNFPSSDNLLISM